MLICKSTNNTIQFIFKNVFNFHTVHYNVMMVQFRIVFKKKCFLLAILAINQPLHENARVLLLVHP